MTGVVILILRVIFALVLYLFLGYILYALWRDLRLHQEIIHDRQIPTLYLLADTGIEEVEKSFTASEVIVGRDPACDFSLKHDTVSARHARFRYHLNQWWLEDLQSTNGTFVNDEPLTTSTVLMSGDTVRCGQVNVAVQIKHQDNETKTKA